MARRLALVLILAACCALSKETPKLKHDYAEVNGVRLHYVSAGKGPLIIFLHGFPEFWYEWKDQLPEFARTIALWLQTCADTIFRKSRPASNTTR
jgi:hypothetical protein